MSIFASFLSLIMNLPTSSVRRYFERVLAARPMTFPFAKITMLGSFSASNSGFFTDGFFSYFCNFVFCQYRESKKWCSSSLVINNATHAVSWPNKKYNYVNDNNISKFCTTPRDLTSSSKTPSLWRQSRNFMSIIKTSVGSPVLQSNMNKSTVY